MQALGSKYEEKGKRTKGWYVNVNLLLHYERLWVSHLTHVTWHMRLPLTDFKEESNFGVVDGRKKGELFVWQSLISSFLLGRVYPMGNN